MAIIIKTVIDAEVREHGFADAADYLTTLVRQDQKRRAKDELEQYILEGIDSGDYMEMTAETWRELWLNLHRQAGIE